MRILQKKKKKSKFLRETIFQRNTLILKMNEYLGATFYRFHVAEKPKLTTQTVKQTKSRGLTCATRR